MQDNSSFAVRVVLEQVESDLTRSVLIGRDCALFTLPLSKGDAIQQIVPKLAIAAGMLGEEIKQLVDHHSPASETGQEESE